VVFTLPEKIRDLAYQNKAAVYTILFQTVAQTLQIIAGDPKHLGAKIGATLVLHTWGSSMIHHPHIHGIVPGGGLSVDGDQWIACKPGFFLPVRVLSRLFRRLFLEQLVDAYQQGKLQCFGQLQMLSENQAFKDWIKPCRQQEWVVYAKRPFSGPEAVLNYLSRYTHRVAIANSRLIAMDDQGITFKWKDYRNKGKKQYGTMTLSPDEFIRRFLLHVLPSGFHRIRHYGLLANGGRKDNIALARKLLIDKGSTDHEDDEEENDVIDSSESAEVTTATFICPDCGAALIVIETFTRGQLPRAPPLLAVTV